MKKILIIDDNPDFREVYRYALEEDGFEIFEAMSRTEAQSIIENGIFPDLILMDLRMEGVSTESFLKFCRDKESLRSTKILALSSYSASDPEVSALSIPFFSKPSSIDEIKEIIRKSGVQST